MSDAEPISRGPQVVAHPTAGPKPTGTHQAPHQRRQQTTVFDRRELNQILNLYGRKVAAGEWRDYAIDMGRETATFSVYRRSSEEPLYRIEKTPKLARKQGAFSVVTQTGLILKRGHELARVLQVLDKRAGLRLVD